MNEVLTLAAAAKRLGVTTRTLRHQVAAGRLAAEQIGSFYVVTPEEVERYRAESLGKPGRRHK